MDKQQENKKEIIKHFILIRIMKFGKKEEVNFEFLYKDLTL